MLIAFIRHGPTAWNEQGRMQGRADIPLDAKARRMAAQITLPARYRRARWLSSPLLRAREWAALLAPLPVTLEPALVEMDWGEVEGSTLAEARAHRCWQFARRERDGLDFRPEGGETPREVMKRLAGLLASFDDHEPTVIVSHKGVMRAALALASGWQMKDKAPVTFGHDMALEFSREDGARLVFRREIRLRREAS